MSAPTNWSRTMHQPQAKARVAPCPLCGAGSSRIWGDPRAASLCSGCGVIWMDPPAALMHEFSEDYYNLYYRPRGAALIADFGSYLDWLRPRASGDRWLDVGCGGGYFAAAALDRGWRVTAVDPSADAIRLAEAVTPGARLIHGDAGDIPPGESFDVISLWDSIAYIPDLNRALGDYLRRLEPGGLLLVKTPHLPLRFHRVAQGLLWWRPSFRNEVTQATTDTWHFTPTSLGHWLRLRGLEVVEHRWAAEVTHGERAPGGSLYGRARSGLARMIRRTMGPHESFVMVARKP